MLYTIQMCTDIFPCVEYLRGFESFAETSFIITDSHSQTFEWQGYGLKLHIPEGAVPADHIECPKIQVDTLTLRETDSLLNPTLHMSAWGLIT